MKTETPLFAPSLLLLASLACPDCPQPLPPEVPVYSLEVEALTCDIMEKNLMSALVIAKQENTLLEQEIVIQTGKRKRIFIVTLTILAVALAGLSTWVAVETARD